MARVHADLSNARDVLGLQCVDCLLQRFLMRRHKLLDCDGCIQTRRQQI